MNWFLAPPVPRSPRPSRAGFSKVGILGALALLVAAPVSLAQQGTQDPPADPPINPRGAAGGLTREQMWSAPTAEDWAKPVLITFQRTWEDAVEVSKETGKAILVCTNMDGEIASEHYAGVRYRQPDIAQLYEPYVCVMASVYRHNPRDYDEDGQRILCPRFGSVTCGEHITVEPILYEKFFDGVRVAPRHVMVELDGTETYDVYYAFDTDSVFQTIRDGIANREDAPDIVTKGDRSIVERVASRDVGDRDAVEEAFAGGDQAMRQALLDAAMANVDKAPVDLLRQAVFGLDVQQSKQARQALAKTNSVSAVDLIAEAMRVPMAEGERTALLDALERIGAESAKARTLAVVYKGLAARSDKVDAGKWAEMMPTLAASAGQAVTAYERTARMDQVDAAAKQRPEDPAAKLDLAEASLAMALDREARANLSRNTRRAEQYAQAMFEDARRSALKAEALGLSGWRVDAAIALANHYLGNTDEAGKRAEAAVAALPPGTMDSNAMGVLGLFAESRMRTIANAIRNKEPWDRGVLTDIRAAYSVMLEHPEATDGHVVAYYDFIRALDARAESARVLDAGLARYPESWALHERFRTRILRERGIKGLETTYAKMMEGEAPTAQIRWFAAYASYVAAEFNRRRGRAEDATAAYERCIEGFRSLVADHPEQQQQADHYVAIALGGQARIAYENGDDATAVDNLLASFELSPASANTLDGLNISAVDTAKMVAARLQLGLKDGENPELSALANRLKAGMDTLPPAMLELPAYETRGRAQGGNRGGSQGQGRGRGQRRRR